MIFIDDRLLYNTVYMDPGPDLNLIQANIGVCTEMSLRENI